MLAATNFIKVAVCHLLRLLDQVIWCFQNKTVIIKIIAFELKLSHSTGMGIGLQRQRASSAVTEVLKEKSGFSISNSLTQIFFNMSPHKILLF